MISNEEKEIGSSAHDGRAIDINTCVLVHVIAKICFWFNDIATLIILALCRNGADKLVLKEDADRRQAIFPFR
jgi:hypothetical protein